MILNNFVKNYPRFKLFISLDGIHILFAFKKLNFFSVLREKEIDRDRERGEGKRERERETGEGNYYPKPIS